MNKIKYALIYLAGIFILISCNDLDQIPTDKHTDETFWKSVDNSEIMVNMAYNQMYSAGKMWKDESLSDNMTDGRGSSDELVIRNGLASPTLGRFGNEWKEAYGGIKTCHTYFANIHRVPDMDDALKNRRIAEMRFIRAYLYFRLVNFYGAVPFFKEDITLTESYTVGRTSKSEIIKFIHEELDDIIGILPSKDELPKSDNGRITRGAAVAFQARVYLYDNEFDQVEKYCSMLINEKDTYGKYFLFSKGYSQLFLIENKYNEEVILDYGYVPNLRTWNEMYDMAPMSEGARMSDRVPTQSLVDDYLLLNGKTIDDPSYNEDNPYVNRDPRMTATIVYHGYRWKSKDGNERTIYIKPGSAPNESARIDEYRGAGSNQTATGYYSKKYYEENDKGTFDSGANIIMFRYADILLMYAEAKLNTSGLDKTVWDLTIKPIRARAGFTDANALEYPSGLSSEELKEIVRRERRCELALEGLRYYDIIRWKEGTKYLNGVVRGAKFASSNTSYITLSNRKFNENRDYLWSVPYSEIDLNPNLRPNNAGYPY